MKFFDRLLTIIITATATSAIWIVFGSAWMERADEASQRTHDQPAESARPATVEAEPSVAEIEAAMPAEEITPIGRPIASETEPSAAED